MHQQRPPKYTHSYIDSCAFDPGGSEERCARRLLHLSKIGSIHLEIADTVQQELDHPNTPSDVRKLSRQLIFTNETSLNPEQFQRRDELRALLRGNAKTERHQADADHIFDLAEYGGGYFITTDNRILSKKEALFDKYFVTPITPCEYEKIVEKDAQ